MALGCALWAALAAPPLRAAPAAGENGTDGALPEAALEQAFGARCEGAPPASAIALIAPLDGLYERYETARCAAAAGRLHEAAEGFRAGLDAPLGLPALWHWELLQAYALAGDHPQALGELEALLNTTSSPILQRRARQLVTTMALDPGLAPPERHEDYLLGYLEHVTPGAGDYDLLLRLHELAEARGNATLRQSLEVLLWRNPKDEAAAARWVALPGERTREGVFKATGADYYGRAERLFSLGLHEQLARELENANLPPLEPTYAKALGRLYFRALIHANLLQHAAVQVNTGSVMRRFAFNRRQQLIWAIRIQLRRRLVGPVMKYLEELEQLSPKDEELPAIFLELLRYNQGRHDTVTMQHWLERIGTEFPDSPEASDAHWQVIWDAIEHGDLERARPLLDAAIAQSDGFHPVDQARLYYWRGRLRARQGDAAGAEADWAEMSRRWPYNYYVALADWMRSGEKLSVHHAEEVAPPTPAALPEIKALWKIPPFPTALFLYAVDEPDLAGEVLDDAVAKPLPPDALEEAGALFYALERHHLQLRLVANHFMDTLRRSRVDSSPLWRRAFPRPHWDVVRREAESQQMDPYFVFAIIREESRFYTGADSSAGAKGLMQLMPATARMVAKRNGLPFEEALLHTPEFNIPLGTLYLKRVLKRFDGNPIYAAAAYNAGPGNVRRWLRRYGKLPLDEFVERIPFGETQRYVKRVFLSYRVYTQLYRDEDTGRGLAASPP